MVKSFKEFISEKRNWKRVAKVGGTTVAASALTGALVGLGAPAGAALGAAYYAASGELRKDLRKKKGDWNYNKKLNEEWYRLSNGSKTNDYQTWKKDYEAQKQQRIKDALANSRNKKNGKQRTNRK